MSMFFNHWNEDEDLQTPEQKRIADNEHKVRVKSFNDGITAAQGIIMRSSILTHEQIKILWNELNDRRWK